MGPLNLGNNETIHRTLQFIPAPTSLWLVRKHFVLSNKSMLLARLIKIQFVLYNSNNVINSLNVTESLELELDPTFCRSVLLLVFFVVFFIYLSL